MPPRSRLLIGWGRKVGKLDIVLRRVPSPPQQRIKRGGKKLIIKKKIREEEGWKNLLTVGNLMDLCAAGSSAV